MVVEEVVVVETVGFLQVAPLLADVRVQVPRHVDGLLSAVHAAPGVHFPDRDNNNYNL